MIKNISLAVSICVGLSSSAFAAPDLGKIVDQQVLPGFENLAQTTQILKTTATTNCDGSSPVLQADYNKAMDAWIKVGHFRFGPAEQNERAFGLAFWPDVRGNTPKALRRLISAQDQSVFDPAEFRTASIAARGFYALEMLMYDDDIKTFGDDTYRCNLIRAVTNDIATVSDEIFQDWQGYYANLIHTAGNNDSYSIEEAVLEFFKALDAALQVNHEQRLKRTLGTEGHPKPTRAENWRSKRSLRNLEISIDATKALALILSKEFPETQRDLQTAFAVTLAGLHSVPGPLKDAVVTPEGHEAVEKLAASFSNLRSIVRTKLGADLGIAAAFNGLDGD